METKPNGMRFLFSDDVHKIDRVMVALICEHSKKPLNAFILNGVNYTVCEQLFQSSCLKSISDF